MGFQKNYAERYDWLYTLFRDWVFMVLTTFLYYEDRDSLEDVQTSVYHQAMASFDGNAPSYHIELHDQPVLVWDFHSLLLGIQMMLAFALTDETKPLHLCRRCSPSLQNARIPSIAASNAGIWQNPPKINNGHCRP